MSGHISLGVAGSLGPDTIGAVAEAAERAGFHALWVNDTPGGDALAGLAAAARTTDRLVLATGVIPIDRKPAGIIAAEIADAELPRDRLVVGVGSGALRTGALAGVRDAVARLRDEQDVRVMVGALGPRMRRLAAEEGDGVLLNWVTPRAAAQQRRELQAVAPKTYVAAYVRTAVQPAALARLQEEAARYGSYPSYAANFERMGVSAIQTTMPDAPSFSLLLPAYTAAVDEVVLRAIPAGDDLAGYLEFVERTAPVAS